MSSYYNPPEPKRQPEIPNGVYGHKVSECCGVTAKAILGADGCPDADTEDYGVCPACHEHCEYVTPEADPDDFRTE